MTRLTADKHRTKHHRIYAGGWIKTNSRSKLFIFIAQCELCNRTNAREWYFEPKRGGVLCPQCMELKWDAMGYAVVDGEPVWRAAQPAASFRAFMRGKD